MQGPITSLKCCFRRGVAAMVLNAALWPASAFAAVTMYSATLTGVQEVPPNASAASAVAVVFLDDVASTIAVNVNFSNLSSLAIGAHVHNAVVGVNGPIVFALASVPSAQSGSIPQQSFAITPALIAELQAGRLYVNIHSVNFSGGEIRGQLALVAAPSCAVSADIIQDGGFELNTDAFTNPNWTSTSTAFDSALCTVFACGTGNDTAAPRTGNGWVWFDGTGSSSSETATAQQTRTLPVGATVSLSYWQQFGAVTPPTSSVMTVKVDSSVVQSIPEPPSADAGYIQRTVDLSAYANGAGRAISFNYFRPSGTTGSDNATIDDVMLAITACPSPGAASPPVFQSAVSRKVHGAAGTFDLPLAATPLNPTTEPRQGPAQTVVFTFNNPITGATVAITEGTASAGAPTFSGNTVIVALTGVSDHQYVTVALTNVSDSLGGTGGSASVRLGFLLGDVNQNRVVAVSDLGLVNAQLAQPVSAANYLKDVNATGTLTVADKGITNANLAHNLPAP